ncbi:hypothetical protein F2Q70_00031846 [Brassica cretica]|uniref:Uncharacterized protein n=1 Tax=Brassica cretica TaxID=69181 RepID=A0A8S9FEF9_BRACR|nr:hypothetical protein F2Q70_00031846 [Brassica cretica]
MGLFFLTGKSCGMFVVTGVGSSLAVLLATTSQFPEKITEEEELADELCTRREYARWLVHSNILLESHWCWIFTCCSLSYYYSISRKGAIHCIVYVWLWITMIMKRVKESLAALMKLKITEEEELADELCTRREYARWLVRSNIFIREVMNATSADPDFEYIQEAGITLSGEDTNINFYPEREFCYPAPI